MKIYKDRVIGFCTIMLGVVMLLLIRDIPLSNLSGDVGSRAFPMISSYMFIGCGFLLVLRNKRDSKPFLRPHQWARLGILFVTFIIYALALTYIGFLFGTPIFLFTISTLMAKYSQKEAALWKKLLYSLLLTGIVYLLFQTVLGIPLPEGIIFG